MVLSALTIWVMPVAFLLAIFLVKKALGVREILLYLGALLMGAGLFVAVEPVSALIPVLGSVVEILSAGLMGFASGSILKSLYKTIF